MGLVKRSNVIIKIEFIYMIFKITCNIVHFPSYYPRLFNHVRKMV